MMPVTREGTAAPRITDSRGPVRLAPTPKGGKLAPFSFSIESLICNFEWTSGRSAVVVLVVVVAVVGCDRLW